MDERRTMKRLILRIGLGLLGIAITAPVRIPAQVETGQLAGTVVDSTGAVIPGAAMTVKNVGTNAIRNGVTSGDGSFRFTGLEPATYEVAVRASGFQPYTARVQITVGGYLTLNARLSVSGTATQVEVIAE